MKAILAHFFSWLFLPLFMPTYGILLTMYIPSMPEDLTRPSMYLLPAEVKTKLLLLFFLFSAAAPGLSFFALHQKKVITTIDIENQRERNIPLLVMMAYSLVLFLLFFVKAPDGIIPVGFYALPLSGFILTSVFMAINKWIKISLHAGGAGILVGFLFAYFLQQQQFEYWVLPAAIIASGLTIAARLYLNKHLPIEVYSGWVLGVLITFCTHFIYLKTL
jgi:membrane-associated phospholipid phosphatase